MSNPALIASMENKIFNMYIQFGFSVGDSQQIAKYIKDNNRLKTWFAVEPQIIELNNKRIVNINTYMRFLDDILEEYPENMFKAPTWEMLDNFNR
jgi:hypothetical protein